MTAGIALVLSELLGFLEAFQNFRGLSRNHVPDKPEVPEDWYPHVDVLIATHNEDVELLRKTVGGCLFLDYPDRRKVHIYLCDDGKRQAVRAMAEEMKIGYLAADEQGDAKAGNLNNGVRNTASPLIVTLDADMIPMHNFLMESVPYFFLSEMIRREDGSWRKRTEMEKEEAEKIGFIQLPQCFYNADLFQFNLFSEKRIPNEQDFFFRHINVRRNYANAPIYAGSNTVISREALQAAGGFATGTITEDMATGMRIQSAGYRCYALSVVAASGLAPTDVESLMKQRERWGRGCIQVMRQNHVLTNPGLTREMKLNYLACMGYWFSFIRRFIYILSPILYAVFGVQVVVCSLWELALLWLPSYLLYNRMLKYVSGNTRSERWNNIIDTIQFPFLILPIIMELFGIRKLHFTVTDKGRRRLHGGPAKLMARIWPHLVLTAFSALGLYRSFMELFQYKALGNPVIIYWLLYNLYMLIMAVFFMLGRKNERGADRHFIREKVTIELPERKVCGRSSDMSETGLGILFCFPEYLPEGELILQVETERYCARVPARLLYSSEAGEGWKYAFSIGNMEEDERILYHQILFDREPQFPTAPAEDLNPFDDLAVNVHRRLADSRLSRRRLPRIAVHRPVKLSGAGLVVIEDFNYEYVRLTAREGAAMPERLSLPLDDGICIRCLRDQEKPAAAEGQWLYRILEPETFAYSEQFRRLMWEWLRPAQRE